MLATQAGLFSPSLASLAEDQAGPAPGTNSSGPVIINHPVRRPGPLPLASLLFAPSECPRVQRADLLTQQTPQHLRGTAPALRWGEVDGWTQIRSFTRKCVQGVTWVSQKVTWGGPDWKGKFLCFIFYCFC